MRETGEREAEKAQAIIVAHIPSVTVREGRERKKERKNGIPNETIRLGTDSEKDLDCMVAFSRILCLLRLLLSSSAFFPHSCCLSKDY